MKNVIWIVIDTLRSDMLASCLSAEAAYNEIDEVMEQGVLFTDVMASGGSTRISAPSYLSSLRPGLTGMANHQVQSLRNFNDDVLTVTEHFKHHGYQTFRWDDSSLDSCQPKRGFDIFESGYPTLKHTPHRNYDNAKRDTFIKKVRKSSKPFFVNFHLDYIHDFGGTSKSTWSTEEYLKVVASQAKDFKALWDKIAPGPDDIAVVTSDHGCILNQDYVEFDKQKPWVISNDRTRVPASFIAQGLAPAKKHRMIRTIDIAPTLLDMAVGADMKAQGVSLKSVLDGGPELELIGLGERNTDLKKRSVSEYACVRKGDWTCNIEKTKPTGLYDQSEGFFVRNYLGEGLPVEKELLDFYRKTVLTGPQSAAELYAQKGLSIDEIRGDIEVSILLPVFSWSEKTRLAVEALLDQILLTELIILDADGSGETEAALAERYNDRLFLRRLNAQDMELNKMLNMGLELAAAPFTVTATPNCQYTENFCYSLRDNFLNLHNTVLSYPNLKRLISDRRNLEYIGNDDCFDELVFSRLGSCFEHKTNTAVLSLPHFNEIGDCAMFETEILRQAGGFSASRTDTIGKTWHKLSRQGRISHVNKGLVISKDKTELRPMMPVQQNEYDCKISILAPLLGPDIIKKLPLFLNMLSAQTEKSIEVLLLDPSEQHELYSKLAENFPDLQVRMINRKGEMSELFNAGLFAARGEYLFWADISDKMLPNCLSALLKELENNGESTGIKCGCLLQEPDKTVQPLQPMAQVREMLCEVCDLRGLLYRHRLHNDIGIFKSVNDNEPGWDMCIRLALVKPFDTIEEPLIIAAGQLQFSIQPTIESFQRILRSTINYMGNSVDLVRLYEDDFRRHQADRARYILEDEMMMTLELIKQSGINSSALLRVPKTHYLD